MSGEGLTEAERYHKGALYGIPHPPPTEGCPYCTDTLRQVGITTLADAARVAARPWANCTGASDCPNEWHEHGCYADTGQCSDPTDHHGLAVQQVEARVLALADEWEAAHGDPPVDPSHISVRHARTLRAVVSDLHALDAVKAEALREEADRWVSAEPMASTYAHVRFFAKALRDRAAALAPDSTAGGDDGA